MDAFDVVGEGVPGTAASIDNRVVVGEQLQAQKSLSQIQPDPFDRIEFRAIGRQSGQGDVVGDDEFLGAVPAGLIQDHDDVDIVGHGLGEAFEKNRHGRGVGLGQDQTEGVAGFGRHGAEDVGRGKAPITQACGALAFGPPAMTKAAFLADPRFILKVEADRLAGMSPAGRLERLQEAFF